MHGTPPLTMSFQMYCLQLVYSLMYIHMVSVGMLCMLGPVVQSIVSLTSSLRGQLVKCFTT